MSSRDPRVDPAQGDVLRWGKTASRVTEALEGGLVRFTQEGVGCHFRAARAVSLKAWRKLTKEATIVFAARGAGERGDPAKSRA